ncbi:MAG: ABC transporter permease [Acidobacteriota bacterium]
MTELRLALRMVRRQPMTAVLAVAALGLGIGLTTLMFSILNGAVLRGLPFEHSERILHIAPFDLKADDDFPASQWEFAEWRTRQAHSFEDLAGFYIGNANVVGPDGTPERYRAAWITPNTFGLLRARPGLGRDFDQASGRLGAEPTAIISDRLWRDRFEQRADVLGQTMRVNGVSTVVVGVMPPRFAFPVTQDLWLALAIDPAREGTTDRPGLEVIGRLRADVSRAQAAAEMAAIEAQLVADDPVKRVGITAEVKTYVEEFIGRQTVQLLTMMLAAVLLVLVIACVNVANLVLARAADRTREVAVRTALGATRTQIVRQTLGEVLVLAVAGAALGLALAWAGIALFNRGIAATNPPFWLDIRIDSTVLLFVTGITVLSALVAGLVPALRASRSDVAPLLNDEGRGSTSVKIGRLSRALVVAEMALSFALLVVSALVIQSILNVTRYDAGFATTDVFAARLSLPASDYVDAASQARFADAVQERLRALPGVVTAALSTSLPPGAPEESVALPGHDYPDDHAYPQARVQAVSASFFDVLRIRPHQGRVFTPGDTGDAPKVAVVSDTFARTHYPDGAVGRQMRVVRGTAIEWRTIVGVVQDVYQVDLGPSVAAGVYLPLAQAPSAVLNLLVHTQGDPLAQTAPVRQAVASLDRNLPIFNPTTIQKNLDAANWGWRVFGTLFTVFGAAALFLATVGLYGVMAFSVSRRTPEIGVRMAVGADSGDVMRMVLTQGAWQVGLGIGAGLGVAVLLSRAMQSMFFQVGPYDPRAFAIVAGLLLVIGLAAAFVPARRAARVDPMTALRTP